MDITPYLPTITTIAVSIITVGGALLLKSFLERKQNRRTDLRFQNKSLEEISQELSALIKEKMDNDKRMQRLEILLEDRDGRIETLEAQNIDLVASSAAHKFWSKEVKPYMDELLARVVSANNT